MDTHDLGINGWEGKLGKALEPCDVLLETYTSLVLSLGSWVGKVDAWDDRSVLRANNSR